MSGADNPSPSPKHILLVFVDGLGWSPENPGAGPCATYGGSLFDFPNSPAPCKPIDACLGIDGLPQSATGQTSLLCGINAQQRIGHHVTGFPSPALRDYMHESSIFRQLKERGLDGIFINAFRPVFFTLPPEMQWRQSATTLAHLAADLPFFDLDDIIAGRSIYQEFTNRALIDKGFKMAEMTPEEAGSVLARNAPLRDFTLYEYFQTDRAGHSQDRDRIEAELLKLDRFMTTLLATVGDDTLVLLTSDHGNLEDISTRRHTRNPVPLMAWGPGAADVLDNCTDITHITPSILAALE